MIMSHNKLFKIWTNEMSPIFWTHSRDTLDINAKSLRGKYFSVEYTITLDNLLVECPSENRKRGRYFSVIRHECPAEICNWDF